MTATMTAPPIDQVAPAVVTRVRDGDLKTGQTALLGLGAVLLVVAFATGLSSDPARFYFSYLTGYMGVLGIALCALFFTMLQHITRAGWSGGVRRVAENICGALPLMLVLFVPILIGFDHLFGHWSHAELDPAKPDFDAIVAGKSVWLNKPFFMARVAIYFGIWIGLATWFRRQSAKQDETGDPTLSLKMSRLAAPGLLLFALSITFAAFDWIMSLDPHWFSTMFGICYFAGGFMSFLAFTILFARWLGTKGYLKEAINTEHYHDLGKLMFAFMVFWTYVNFSQYMLIWYANLPEETTWYMNRLHGGWGAVGTLLVFGHFLVPFAYLMSRHIKRNPIALGVGAAYLLVIHWIDMQYLILPNASHGHGAEHAGEHAAAAHGGADSTALFGEFSHNLGEWMHGLTLGDVLCYLGLLSLLAGAAVFFVRKNNLLPTRDPRLPETLSFQNI